MPGKPGIYIRPIEAGEPVGVLRDHGPRPAPRNSAQDLAIQQELAQGRRLEAVRLGIHNAMRVREATELEKKENQNAIARN